MVILAKRHFGVFLGRMALRPKKMKRFSLLITLLALSVVLLAACERDSEAEVRATLGQWFFLGQTAYFDSQSHCTGAMFHLNLDRPRPNIPIQTNVAAAKYALRADGLAAVRIDGRTPADLIDALRLTGDGDFGKHAIEAGSLAGPCFQGVEIASDLYAAFNRPSATLAYDMQRGGLMVLDSDQKRLFYIAGDVW